MEMKNVNWKELFIDILVDIVAGMIIAVGIYNFALNADFPVAGFPVSRSFCITYSDCRSVPEPLF